MAFSNILYMHSHDTGRYVQPYGYAIPTPHIQHLAEEGVLFRQAFSAAPTCSPSRASLLTGQYPHSNGMLGLAHRGFALSDYSHLIIHALHRAGYFSAEVGTQHIAQDRQVMGYNLLIPTASNKAADVAPAAVQFLQGSPPQPFFLSVGFEETHRPYSLASEREDPRYTRPPVTLPDTPDTRQDMASLAASARLLDDAIGSVLLGLDASGLAANTLVVCTTDHGIAFPGMKCTLTDHGIGVALILRGPEPFAEGEVTDALVSQVDLFPTVCDWLDLPPPTWLQGRSLMPIVRGQADQVNEEIFAEVNYHAAYEPQRAVRTRRLKYIRRFDERTHPVLPNTDDSPSKNVWLAAGWRERLIAREELYDLVFDPQERNNLVHDPTATAALEEMRDRLQRWMERTQDPLLRGDVPAPAGARVNDADGVSPSEAPQTR